MKLFLVVNVDSFFLSHRKDIALQAMKSGYDVTVLTKNTGKRNEIESLGIHFLDIPFERSGYNPIHELKCIYRIYKCYCQYRPEVIHHITLKAVLLGSLAAKFSHSRHVVNAISGLGYNFTNGRKGIMQILISLLIRVALKSKYFFFILQNPDDVEMIRDLKLVPNENIYLIKGSGIDLKQYSYVVSRKKEILHILFPARILLDKGVKEFIEAAKKIRNRVKGKALFLLAGDCDEGNLSVLRKEDLYPLLESGYIEWIGFQTDMFSVYQDCDIVVLPSYREGLPKSLIEACAVGRPIITTNVPGCKECVKAGWNGFLVPVKNSEVLAECIQYLIENQELRQQMGRHSRELAENNFSLDTVVRKHLEIYKKMSE